MFYHKNGISLASGSTAVLMLVIVGVVAIVGIQILDQVVATDPTSIWINSSVNNASLGIGQITSQMNLIGLIVVMSIVIALLYGSFGGFMGYGQGNV